MTIDASEFPPVLASLFERVLASGEGDVVVLPVLRGREMMLRSCGVATLEDLALVSDVVYYSRKYDEKTGKTSSYSVDQVEQIMKRALLSPYGDIALIIIESIEDMSLTATNKLLKIFEDIPSKTLFILLSDSSDALLPTIRSRVKVLEFSAKQLSDQDYASHPLTQAIDAYVCGDLVSYYRLMNEDMKKVTFQRDSLLEVCEYIRRKYPQGSYHLLTNTLLQAQRDIHLTNLPLRAVLDEILSSLVIAPVIQ